MSDYWLSVDQDAGDRNYKQLYRGKDITEAMAAWSKAISEGVEYVMIEALLEPKPSGAGTPGG